MTLAHGIVVGGIWICAGMVWHSKTATGAAAIIITVIAISATIWFA